MARLNRMEMLARLGKDPELKTTQGGKSVLNLRVAIDDGYKTKEGEKVERTTWLDLVCFDRRAEALAGLLRKGELIYAAGRLEIREYEKKDGSKGTSVSVVADTIELLGGKRGEREQGESKPRPQSTAPAHADDFGDDEIPF